MLAFPLLRPSTNTLPGRMHLLIDAQQAHANEQQQRPTRKHSNTQKPTEKTSTCGPSRLPTLLPKAEGPDAGTRLGCTAMEYAGYRRGSKDEHPSVNRAFSSQEERKQRQQSEQSELDLSADNFVRLTVEDYEGSNDVRRRERNKNVLPLCRLGGREYAGCMREYGHENFNGEKMDEATGVMNKAKGKGKGKERCVSVRDPAEVGGSSAASGADSRSVTSLVSSEVSSGDSVGTAVTARLEGNRDAEEEGGGRGL
ncbi:hypothetical protein B0A55_00235 [Friedmanniomyces simplex]|uniref:Uncharacterized protein n=1 Tax=Friedmanniomyces simplex TaxID=329884 RepID=A0A4U0Y0R1_9PEZI|nr:hypothetical protein B0A55_00235 [Friedmanniomyces simplex]